MPQGPLLVCLANFGLDRSWGPGRPQLDVGSRSAGVKHRQKS